MPRAFWKGVISFGLVAIPVKMYVGTESKTLSFHLLHKKCLTRPKQVLHCETDDEYFSIKDTVRGYEVAKEQYVVLNDSDFEKVPIRTSHAIDILGFVEAKEIDPIYYFGIHYLEPEELGAKPFRLLREALEKTGRVGVAKVSFQRREHLGCLRPLEDILVLHTMHYATELLSRKELFPSKTRVTEAELDMAVSLVKAMAKSFTPEEYKDEYQEALKKVIEAKVTGEKIVAPAAPKAEIVDLMATLRASIEAAKKEPAIR
ncbi:MAG: Ku protein [Chloroflexi bacterium]|nr:Ku protein [Chloroflexota bacterium]